MSRLLRRTGAAALIVGLAGAAAAQTASPPAAMPPATSQAAPAVGAPGGSAIAPSAPAADPAPPQSAVQPASPPDRTEATPPADREQTAPPEAGLIEPERIAKEVAERTGLDVLRVQQGELAAGPVYYVSVMEPGGNSNSAFRVTTVTVDARSGAVIPPFRHRPVGYELQPSVGGQASFAADGRTIREETFRGR